jgi:hypothetical protein
LPSTKKRFSHAAKPRRDKKQRADARIIIDFAIVPGLDGDLIQRTRYKEKGLSFLKKRMQLFLGDLLRPPCWQ